MQIMQNVPLGLHSTMRLGGAAAYAADIQNREEVGEAFAWAKKRNLPLLMIGSGSNIVWRDEGFNGLLLINKIMGYEIKAENENDYYLTLGAGENWDSVVARTAAAGLNGIEALSLIPGSVGATPVQNVGAYGQEISQTLVSLEAFDSEAGKLINIPAPDCGFGYRTSRFKTADHGRFLITSILLHLRRGQMQAPFYPVLQKYLDKHNIRELTPKNIREAVITIRQAKLPDPAQIANNGSFFANPIIAHDTLMPLLEDHKNLVYWPQDNGRAKLSAAWLVEQAGFKDYHDEETGMATWPSQSLVLINEYAKNTADLLKFKQKIIDRVQEKFGITLEQEPELLP
jgi:UDP-N-acetylmuramate dehydrogenase